MTTPDCYKYGAIQARIEDTVAAPMAASEVLKAKGANFVVRNSSGHYEIVGVTSTLIDGILVGVSDETCSSTAGETIKRMLPMEKMPFVKIKALTGTLTQAMVGLTCDLAISSNRMGIDVEASTYDQVKIVEVNTDLNYAIVIPNITKLTGYSGVI